MAHAATCLLKMDYRGPLVLCTDDTKLERALQAYKNSKGDWLIVGGSGEPLLARPALVEGSEEAVPDIDIMDMLRNCATPLADKLRLYALVVPLLKVCCSIL